MSNVPSFSAIEDTASPLSSTEAPANLPQSESSAIDKPKRRITQLDIARAAGVHNTTVSLALRNSPLIPACTRERVQALAEKLGYHPDPALRALIVYRNRLGATSRTEPIAYVTSHETRWGWRGILTDERHFVGAQRKAGECGYRLEHFWLGEPSMTRRRLSDVLFHRGIKGILLAPLPADYAGSLEFDWDRFSAVELGYSRRPRPMHRVLSDPAGAIRLAMKQVLAAGYRRIGLMLPEKWDKAADRSWSFGFLNEQSRLAAMQRIPIFLHQACDISSRKAGGARADEGEVAERSRAADWFSEFQPDVILGASSYATGLLSRLGLHVPRDVAFVDLHHEGDDPAVAGVRQNCEQVGEVAVDVLVNQLQQNLRGVPVISNTTLVGGLWCDGASMPRAGVSDPLLERTLAPEAFASAETAA